MNKANRAIAALGAALTLTTVAVAGAMPAPAATPGWRIVFTTHYGAASTFSGFTTVIAPGRLDAWAFGANDLSGGSPELPVAVHWTGTAWQAGALPAGVTSDVTAASAVSVGNIWAVTQFGGYVLHWNGSWSVAKQLPGSGQDTGQVTGVTALSSTDVWVFGSGGFTSGLGTWHYNGSTWTQQTGSASGISSASALSASNIWAIGSDGVAPQDTIVHYNGSAWQPVTAGALTGLQFNRILAISATNVWASAENPANGTVGFLVHFDGSVWSQVTLPWTVATGDLASDGQGGIWLTTQDTSGNSWVAQMSAGGAWSRTAIASSSATHVAALALIPGTTALWGAGAVGTTTGSNAAVWAFGVPPVAGPPAVAVAAAATNGVPYAQAPQLGSGWHSLGGKVSAAPAVAAPPNPEGATPASALFIAPGTNHLLYIRGLTGSWQRLGPQDPSCLGSPAAVITGSTLTVACQGINHVPYYGTATVPSTGLPVFKTAWKNLGGVISAGPAVAPVGGVLTFFVRGVNGKIYTRTLTTTFKAAAWTCLGQPAAALQAATGVTYFACQGTNHGLYEGTVTSAGLGAAVRLSGTLAAGPAIAATTSAIVLLLEGTNHVVYQGTPTTSYAKLGGITVTGVEAAALN